MSVRRTDKEDWLLRIIRQISEMIARVREQIAQSTISKTEAQAQIQQSIVALLGRDAPMLDRLDAETAAQLLADRKRVELWASLIELDAEVLESRDEVALAQEKRARAAALIAAAARLPV